MVVKNHRRMWTKRPYSHNRWFYHRQRVAIFIVWVFEF